MWQGSDACRAPEDDDAGEDATAEYVGGVVVVEAQQGEVDEEHQYQAERHRQPGRPASSPPMDEHHDDQRQRGDATGVPRGERPRANRPRQVDERLEDELGEAAGEPRTHHRQPCTDGIPPRQREQSERHRPGYHDFRTAKVDDILWPQPGERPRARSAAEERISPRPTTHLREATVEPHHLVRLPDERSKKGKATAKRSKTEDGGGTHHGL